MAVGKEIWGVITRLIDNGHDVNSL
jgi:hypothetical protein